LRIRIIKIKKASSKSPTANERPTAATSMREKMFLN